MTVTNARVEDRPNTPWQTKLRVVLPAAFVGSMLLQLAWIASVPPFRGSDEFDHAHRAASVARGQWTAGPAATDGRGELVRVPGSLAAAAEAQCSNLEYTGVDNCRPVHQFSDETVLIASAAARYNPGFYWLVGVPSRPFDGAAALRAMRVSGALLCSMFVVLAAWATSLWARTPWPGRGLLVAMTPVLIYSTALPAPNGLEMVGALSLWACLLGVYRSDDRRTQLRLLLAGVPGTLVLANVRYMGPAFLTVLLAVVLLLWGRQRTRVLAHTWQGTLFWLTVLASVATGLGWTAAMSTTEVSDPVGAENAVAKITSSIPVWLAQTIAAFPLRNEQAPTIVYAAYGLTFLGMLGLATWLARRRIRLILLLVSVGVFVMPIVLTALTYSGRGAIWQGRYGLPLAVGICVLSGLALDSRAPVARLLGPILLSAWICLAGSHVVSVASVLLKESRSAVARSDPSWTPPDSALIVLTSLLGFALLSFVQFAIRGAQLPERPNGLGASEESVRAHG